MDRTTESYGATQYYVLIGLALARIPLAIQALTNFVPVLGTGTLVAVGAVVAYRFRRHDGIRLATAGTILGSLVLEGLLLYPTIMVLDTWTALLLGTGLLTAVVVTNSLRTTRLPWRIAFASICILTSGSIFSSISDSPVQAWIVPMGVAGTLLLLGAIYGRLLMAQQQAIEAHRQHAAVSAKLALASAEILDSRHRESLAMIASGIAHEVNNPITYLRGNLELLEEQLTSGTAGAAGSAPAAEAGAAGREVQHLLKAMRTGIEAIGTVVDRVRTIYRETKAPPQRVSLRQAVDLAVASLPSKRHHYAGIVNDVSPDIAVTAHPADVYIVASNLIRNAVEATTDRHDAEVRISAEAVGSGTAGGRPGSGRGAGGADDGPAAGRTGGGPGSAATQLVVADNGRGMSAREIEKCTDPFHTSKSESGGMGVGLAIVQAIADRTGGQLHFESKPGAGTTARYVFAQGGDE